MTVLDWLLDSDPSIRWQVMRDLLGESELMVSRERSRVAVEGWGARLLDLQGPDGHWGGAAFVPHAWISTQDTLQLLRDLGVDPTSDRTRRAIDQVRDRCTWGKEFGDSPFFEGEVEPCINGRVLAVGAYFGQASDRLVDRLLQEQLRDGGWNCDAPRSRRSSFHTTICVLEGLLEYETAKGPRADVAGARLRGQEYLLERRLFRSRSTGQVISHDRKTAAPAAWTQISFPTRWHYDILWGLDYLRRAGAAPDERVAEAVDLVGKKRDEHGRWPLENPHPGPVHFEMEGRAGEPSRWNTLRALRVLRWANGS
ncbi:MAG TPA: hypothetical protein VGY48_02730 [Vicinamibacterales bacterium]|nr:hypothetical protein [Vicinamibacterales bacterium]